MVDGGIESPGEREARLRPYVANMAINFHAPRDASSSDNLILSPKDRRHEDVAAGRLEVL